MRSKSRQTRETERGGEGVKGSDKTAIKGRREKRRDKEGEKERRRCQGVH